MNPTSETAVNPSDATPEVSVSSAPATSEKASLKNFMSMVGDQKCDFSDTETGSSGVVYLNSGKFRGDFSSNVNGKVTPSHMINDGKDVYIWMDDQTTGFKTSLAAIEEMSGQTGSTQAVDLNKEVDYTCASWTVDPIMFAVPTEVKFQDMSKMMENMGAITQSPVPGATSSNAAACAACENLEGDSQAQCKKALKCN